MARKLKLGVDIDSTIWNSREWYHEFLVKQGVEPPLPHEIDTWSYYFDRYGKDIATRMFNESLDQSRIWDRPLFDGVEYNINRIRLWGIEPVFITHSFAPDGLAEALTPWLRDHFDSKCKVCVLEHHEPKLDILQAVGAFGIIDDKAETLIEVADAGLFAAGMYYGYNVEATSRDDVYGYHHWDEVPDLVWQYFQSLKEIK